MKTPEEMIEELGGALVANMGFPRVRVVYGGAVHSMPADEERLHTLKGYCPCKAERHKRSGFPLFVEHHQLLEKEKA